MAEGTLAHMLRLHGTALSRSSRCLWMLEELGAEYEHIPVKVGLSGTGSAAFRALNPNGRMPVLEDGGLLVWESFAVNLYLAERFDTPLGPRDAGERAQMTMWTIWATTEFEPDAHTAYEHTITWPEHKRDPAEVAAAMARLDRPFKALAASLEAGQGHLIGGRFTVAELNIAAVAHYLRGVPDAMKPYPAVADWYAGVTGRPAFQKMLQLRERAAAA